MSINCPKFGYGCENPLCSSVNEPLEQAIPEIRRNFENGVRWNVVHAILNRQIVSEANALCVNLHPTSNGKGIVICPSEVIERELGQKLGIVIAGEALRAIAKRCVDDAVYDLRQIGAYGNSHS